MPDSSGAGKDRIYRLIEGTTATVLVGVIVVALTLQVFFRYVVRAPLFWSEELARFVLIWSVFAGATFAFRHRSHMSIDVVRYIVPARFVGVVDIVGRLVMTAFFALLALISWQFVLRFADIKSAAMEIPLAVVYIILPATSVASIVAVWLPKKGE